MPPKELDRENVKIMKRAYDIYKEHGSRDGRDVADWLEAEKQGEVLTESRREDRVRKYLWTAIWVLCFMVGALFLALFHKSPGMEMSPKDISDMKVMMLVMDPKANETLSVFGDTHFDFDQSSLTPEAKALLDSDVRILRDKPTMRVRMAGYTSASGTEETNQKLSEERANRVRNYLIEKGIAPSRIAVIGYGRTKPALFEENPALVNSKEAKANMRVLFEIIVK